MGRSPWPTGDIDRELLNNAVELFPVELFPKIFGVEVTALSCPQLSCYDSAPLGNLQAGPEEVHGFMQA